MMNEAKEHSYAIGRSAPPSPRWLDDPEIQLANIPAAPSRNAEGLSMPERMAAAAKRARARIGIGQSATVRTGYQGSAGLKATPDELVALASCTLRWPAAV